MASIHIAICMLVLASSTVTVLADGYDPSIAGQSLMLSYGAYCDASTISTWTCQWCEKVPGYEVFGELSDASTNTFGYVAYDNSTGAAIVSFRGTVASSLQNWITDLNYSQTISSPFGPDGAEIHDGFYYAYSLVADSMKQYLSQVFDQYPASSALLITGHSLGGALAVLAAADLSATYSNMLLYTFGQPRVGNQVFAQWFDELENVVYHWRVVNYRDIVPHLPPLVSGFYHMGTEVWYQEDSNSQYVVCNGSGEDPNCSDSLELPISVEDHLNYFGIYEACDY